MGGPLDDLFCDPRWDPYGLLREAYLSVTRHIDAQVSPAGDMDAAISDLLFRLARTPDYSLRAIDITRALATSTTRTTRVVDFAQAQGFVVRAPHPTDRRATVVSLTAGGMAEARRRGVVALDAAQRYIHDILSPAEIDAMTALLRKLRDGNQAIDGR
ncbi:MarR family winged helix-turn-helix transcriptional regulator [Nocardia wallacei]|uniref:HTH marR-type domain-containing protein n=1 Tax=Nocardia wallacei TaxID=480035 RepID=A0A7G1KL53_9NOCA|nr:MarR family winged helix-turn-helix transcriptional regulator [Nocardia wallacei]BCK55296.1 hypothetical protein NWFMUON74_30680 [Nocardia wallacei]